MHPITETSKDTTPPTAAGVLLVVDDEYLIRWSLRNRLTTAGYRVREAATAAAARTEFGHGDVQLVLLDIKLPDGNGMDLLREFRQVRPETKVIMISAHGTPETAQRAKDDGAFDFVSKPFDLNEMTTLVDRAAAR